MNALRRLLPLLGACASLCACTRPPASLYAGIPVLMYHRLGDAPPDLWTVSAGDFASQMRDLKQRGFETVLPADLTARRALPQRPIVITFDDGYLSTLTVAEPILRQHGFRGVVYLVAGFVADRPEDRQSFEGHPCLTWPEVRELSAHGVFTIGVHGFRHVGLEEVADIEGELAAARRVIRDRTGLRPDSFSYPFGRHDERAVQAVKRAGFTTALTAAGQYAPADRRRLDPWTIPRLIVFGGQHAFETERLAAPADTTSVCFRVTHRGVGIPVIPRLVWPEYGKEDGWLPMEVFVQGTREWNWPLPPGRARRLPEARLELWEGNRVFRLHASPAGDPPALPTIPPP